MCHIPALQVSPKSRYHDNDVALSALCRVLCLDYGDYGLRLVVNIVFEGVEIDGDPYSDLSGRCGICSTSSANVFVERRNNSRQSRVRTTDTFHSDRSIFGYHQF